MLRSPAVLRGAPPAAPAAAALPRAPGVAVGPRQRAPRSTPARAAALPSDNGAPRTGGSRRKPRAAAVVSPPPVPPPASELVESLVSGLPFTALDDPASSYAGGAFADIPQLSPRRVATRLNGSPACAKLERQPRPALTHWFHAPVLAQLRV